MNSINIIGNLTRDPILRTVKTMDRTTQQMVDTPVCNFTVACNDIDQLKDTENKPIPQYFRVTQWRNAATACNQFLKKGSKVAVRGAICIVTNTGEDGREYTNMEIASARVEFLTTSNSENRGNTSNQAPAAANTAPANMPQYDAPATPAQQNFVQVDEDELPF